MALLSGKLVPIDSTLKVLRDSASFCVACSHQRLCCCLTIRCCFHVLCKSCREVPAIGSIKTLSDPRRRSKRDEERCE